MTPEESEKKPNIIVASIRVLRPKQWTKNLIAYTPLLFGHKFSDPNALLSVTICVMCLCLVSGSVYVLNDLKDREADAKHPTKKKRLIASGKISPGVASGVGITAMLIGLIVAFMVRPAVALVLVAYLVLQVIYNLSWKNQPILDCFSIACGFVLRALAGGAACHVPLSAWFLLCTSLGALFLALEKRRQELQILGAKASEHRKVFDKYSVELLNRMEAVVVPSLLTSYAIYCYFSPYGQWMMLSLPFAAYGIFRYQYLSVTKTITAAPEEVLVKDRHIQLSILLWLLTSAGVIYGYIPEGMKMLKTIIG